MALALYRKYRPRTFAEIIGQEHVTEPLMQALRTGRLNHAYLFSGPRGCGKTSSARILARSLNCEQGPTPEPCGECDSCVALAPDGSGSIDVIEIDAASHGGVDDARDLRERAIFAPVSSRFKVYVIDEAHMVSSAGFNALLKLVEEPPDYVKFVFATTEPDKVLGTIKSRTHHYPFRLIPPGVLRPHLERLCESEAVKVEPAVFPLVVRAGGGSARDSLSVLDQLIAGAGAEGVTYGRAVALLGVTDVALIDEMCDALAAGDGAAAFATIDRVAEAGHDARRFASDLLERLRDLIVMQQVPDAAAKGLLDVPDDEVARMALQAQRFGQATLSRLADIVHNGLTEMRGTTAPRLLLELICARMLLPGADDSSGALLQRLERMERRLTMTGDTPAPPIAQPAASPTSTPAQPTPAQPMTPQATPAQATPAQATAPQATAPQATRAEPTAAEPTAAEPAAGPTQAASSGPTQPGPSGPAQAAPAPDQPATAPTIVDTSGGSAAPRPAPGAVDAAAVRRVWEEILTYLGRKSRKAAAVAREATVREVDGDTLVLTFKHTVHATMLSNSPELLLEAIFEVFGGKWRVRCEVGGPAGGSGAARSAAGPATPPPSGGSAQPRSGHSAQTRSTGSGATVSGAAASGSVTDDSWPTPATPGGGLGGAGGSTGGGSTGGGGSAPATRQPTDQVAAGSRPPSASWGGDATSHPASTGGALGSEAGGGVAPGGPGGANALGGASAVGSVAGSGAAVTVTAPAPIDPRAAARAAASGRGLAVKSGRTGSPGTGGRGNRSAAGPGNGRGPAQRDPAWDAPSSDEPPFDPDYDPPVRDAASYEGFDPGDEPLDDVIDEQTARQTSEEQAIQLLREALGAEKIDEAERR